MEFRILGPLDARAGGETVHLGGLKPRALLAMLLLHPNETVSAERLAMGLWGEEAGLDAVKTLHVHVSRLRKALGDADAAGDDRRRLPAERAPGRARPGRLRRPRRRGKSEAGRW